MASLNKVIIMGNLTRDPEVRYIPSGTAVAELGIAVNERVKKDNEWVERPTFIDVTVWGRQAETCGEYLSKGSPALVEGRLQLDTWESKTGEKRSKLKVVADRVQFIGAPRSAAYGDAPAGGASSSASSGEPSPSPSPAGSPAAAEDDDDLPF